MDLGDCVKMHNLALKADYEIASPGKDYFYDLDALEQLSIFVAEADRKTEQARKRLAETQEELSTEVSGKADKVHELGEKIGEALARAEQLGAEGLVDESMKLMEEIDALRKQKSEAESDYRSSIPAATYQQQKLRVCDVCCAYLGIHDNDRRLADHFGGKLHLGFIKIRETLKEFQEIAEERRRKRRDHMRLARLDEEEKTRRRERELRDKERSERKRSNSPSRDKSAGRDDRDRRRGSDHDRKKRSRRSKSRSRSPRDRDHKRSHKDKKRSRSKERRDRSRSKERRSKHSD
ncbi:putative RNA-binding protein Luc7-like 2 isoform X2 [Folsomia candida]|nr:putative RNA-binding protein Luc7-like 2 isoform X2 [Folsomia candida]